MVNNEGFCCGGPYDGMWGSEPDTCSVVAYDFDPPLDAEEPLIRYGFYRFNLGKWIWSPANATHPGEA